MFSNTIEFLAPKVVLEDKDAHPLPIKKLIPDWYKKLSADKDTVKNCMPFLDTLTTGYALPLTSDLIVKFNHIETDDTIVRCPHEASVRFAVENNLNVAVNPLETVHPRWQLEGSPLLNKNRNPDVLFDGIRKYLEKNKTAYEFLRFEFLGRNYAGSKGKPLKF